MSARPGVTVAELMPMRGVSALSHRLPRGLLLAVLVAVALTASFAVGLLAHPGALRPPAGSIPDASPVADAEQVAALLARSEATVAELDAALSERDRNPLLTQSVAWVQRYAGLVSELQEEYQAALALRAPAGETDVQACLSEGLRLTSTGASMLHDAFLTGGHGAYYLSAHGNWDLNLGAERLQHCRALLTRAAPASRP